MGAADDHLSQRTALQQNLAQTFINQLQSTFSSEIVQPVMNIPAGYAAGYVSEKFAESLAEFFKSDNQKEIESAEPVKIKKKRKNKFTPGKRENPSDQDTVVETNDEDSTRSPFKKFTNNKRILERTRIIRDVENDIVNILDKTDLTPEKKAQAKADVLQLKHADPKTIKQISEKYINQIQNLKNNNPNTWDQVKNFWDKINLNPFGSNTAHAAVITVPVMVFTATVILYALALQRNQGNFYNVGVSVENYLSKSWKGAKSFIKKLETLVVKDQSTVNQPFTPSHNKPEQEYIPIHEDPNKGIIADPIPPERKPDIETVPAEERKIDIEIYPDGSEINLDGNLITPIPEDIGATIHYSDTNNVDPKEIADKIANGHAYDKHVLGDSGKIPGIETREQFAEHIERVIENKDDYKELTGGRKAWWHEETGTVVIHNPNSPDGGTAVRSRKKDYFNKLE